MDEETREIELRFFLITKDENGAEEWNRLVKHFETLETPEIFDYTVDLYKNNYRKTTKGDITTTQIKEEKHAYNYEAFRFKISDSEEKEIDIPENATLTGKRNISRTSFTFDDYRYDFSKVTFSRGEIIKYEVEIEWTKNGEINEAIVTLEKLGKELYYLLTKTDIPFDEQDKKNAFYELSLRLPGSISTSFGIQSIKNFADKPIDLYFQDLSTQDNKDKQGFFANPCYVTHKVDGIRKQILCVKRWVFLIDDKNMNLITKEGPEMMFFIDGELYENTSYYPFDVYFGENVNINSNHGDKLKFIRSIKDMKIKNITFKVKTSLLIEKYNIFEVLNEILDERSNLPFENDGLIFTPAETKANFNLDQTKNSRKWKPHSKLTMDFKLIENPKKRRTFLLGTVKGKNIVPYDKPMVKGNKPYIKDTRMKKDQIWEFSFNTFNNKFIPIKLRDDKLYPNTFPVVESLMSLILNPVKESMLRGEIEGKKDSGIENMRNFHRDHKKKLISKCLEYVKDLKEESSNPHSRNWSEYSKSPPSTYAQTDEKYSSFAYLPSCHLNTIRDKILTMISFIGDKNENFKLIGFTEVEREKINEILAFFSKSTVTRLTDTKNMLDSSFNLISFAETQEEKRIFVECVNKRSNIKHFLCSVRVSTLVHETFMHFGGDILYPIYDNDILYICSGSDDTITAKEVYSTKLFREHLGYYITKIKRRKYDTKHEFYDDCYSCYRERDILASNKNGEAKFFIDRLCSEGIYQGLATYNNTILDIGTGKASNRFKESGAFVLGLEPNFENYEELVRRKSDNLKFIPVNMGLSDEDDIREIVSRLGSMKVGVTMMMDSLTFFHGDKIDLVPKLIENVLVLNGIFAIIVVDGKRLTLSLENAKFNIDKFMIQTIHEDKILISVGKESIVQQQVEYKFDVDSFIDKMERVNCEVIEDYYLDYEHFMSKQEYLYSSSTRVVIFRRFGTKETIEKEIETIESIEF